jgi:hypothetical protein
VFIGLSRLKLRLFVVVNGRNKENTLIFVHPGEGGIESYYNTLLPCLSKNYRIIVIDNYLLKGKEVNAFSSFDVLAKYYIGMLPIDLYNDTKLYLGGYSFGTMVAYEIIHYLCNEKNKVIPAEIGGETPIVDSRQVFNKINKKIINKFDDKRILYSRKYTPGIDLDWKEVFQTEDKQEVEKYCNQHNIEFTWHDQTEDALELTTSQICQATLTHPVTSDKVWFNQAHLFHMSALDEDERQALTSVVGSNAFPRNAYYGDGSELSEADLKHIRSIYDDEKIMFKWERGDVMILDNVLMAHGREPFTGNRKVFVAMG